MKTLDFEININSYENKVGANFPSKIGETFESLKSNVPL